MKEKEIEKKIKNVEEAIETLEDVLNDLKKQQFLLSSQNTIRVKEDTKVENNISTPNSNPVAGALKREKELLNNSTGNTPQQTMHKKENIKVKPIRKPFDLLVFCQTWLPRIFVVIMLLGVVWLFKAGIDTGLLQPPVRLVFGGILAIILYMIGDRQIVKQRQALGLVLLGGSIASVVLTTFAAHFLYDYLPATFAFILNVIWIVLGIVIADMRKSEYLAIFVAIGGFFVPFLIENSDPNLYIFLGYETLLTVSLLVYGAFKKLGKLYVTSYVVAQPILLLFALFNWSASLDVEYTVIYIIVQTVLYFHLTQKGNFIKAQRFGMLIVNGALLLEIISKLERGMFTALLTSGVIYLLITIYELQKNKKSVLSTITFALSMLSLLLLFTKEFSGSTVTILMLVQGFSALFVAYILKDKVKAIIGGIVYLCGSIFTITASINSLQSTDFIAHLLLVITVSIALYKTGSFLLHTRKTYYQALFYWFMFVIFITITKVGSILFDNSDFNSLTVSFLWMLYATASVWFGRSQKGKKIFTKNEIVLIGLLTLIITVGKLFFIDLPFVSMTIRAILFLIVGAIGVGISRLFFTKNTSK